MIPQFYVLLSDRGNVLLLPFAYVTHPTHIPPGNHPSVLYNSLSLLPSFLRLGFVSWSLQEGDPMVLVSPTWLFT